MKLGCYDVAALGLGVFYALTQLLYYFIRLVWTVAFVCYTCDKEKTPWQDSTKMFLFFIYAECWSALTMIYTCMVLLLWAYRTFSNLDQIKKCLKFG